MVLTNGKALFSYSIIFANATAKNGVANKGGVDYNLKSFKTDLKFFGC